MAEPTALIPEPDLFSRIASLKIRARQLVEGLLSGQHRSRHKGSSVEFAEYKDYSPGDEIRHIDWKVVGKTDKYHVKQFEQSTNLKCTIMLDASGSMGYVPPKGDAGLSKMDYARTLVSALSYLLLKQFDSVGLLAFNDRVVTHIPPRSKPSHFQDLVQGLAAIKPGGATRVGQVVAGIVERLKSRSLLILVSDLLAREDDIYKDLKLIRARGIEVILFHILHPDEVRLPFDGDIIFESLEDDPPVGLDPVDIREGYRKIIQEQIAGFRRSLTSLGADYIFLETTDPLDQALSYYLLKRNSLAKT